MTFFQLLLKSRDKSLNDFSGNTLGMDLAKRSSLVFNAVTNPYVVGDFQRILLRQIHPLPFLESSPTMC